MVKDFSRLTVLALAICAVQGCNRNYIKADHATLGRVVVYRNGVAYYERRARLSGDTLTLSVPQNMVDDFLKSLTVKDAKTGKNLPVSFPSRPEASGDQVTMAISVPAGPARDVVLSYITESPAWKPSYRVVVGDDDKVQLQGWAVVDNTSGEDWKNVLVGVGSSSALSFRYDLWSVRPVHRYTLRDQQAFALAPPTGTSPYKKDGGQRVLAELGVDDIGAPGGATADAAAPMEDRVAAAPRKRPARRESAKKVEALAKSLRASNQKISIVGYQSAKEGDGLALERANRLRNQLIEQGVAPANLTVRAGSGRGPGVQLVSNEEAEKQGAKNATPSDDPIGESHFESGLPMSVASGKSVMVSILDGDADGEVVYVYDPHSARGNKRFAFKAVRLENPTDSTLETGPVTVYGQSRFIGEGLTEPIGPRATAVIPFALDKQVIVESKRSTRDTIDRMVKLSRGVLTTEVKHTRKTEYSVTNRSRKNAKIYVRHPVSEGWNLTQAPKNRERVGAAHLFAVNVEAGKSGTVIVEESTPMTRTVNMRTSSALEMVEVYLKDSSKKPALASKVKELLEIHRALADHRQALENLRRRQDEYRVRLDELHAQIVTLKAVKSGGSLMRHLQSKMRQISERVQTLTIQAVEREEKILLARVKLQDEVAELSLETAHASR